MSTQIVRISAPALAGLLYLNFGLLFICIFNAATYFLSAVIIIFLDLPEHLGDMSKKRGFSQIAQDIHHGFQLLRVDRLAKWILFVYDGLQLGAGAIVVLIVMFVKNALEGTDAIYGLIISVTAAGSLLGATMGWV